MQSLTPQSHDMWCPTNAFLTLTVILGYGRKKTEEENRGYGSLQMGVSTDGKGVMDESGWIGKLKAATLSW